MCTLWPWPLCNGVWKMLFTNNLLYGTYIYFNIVHFLYGGIFNRCTLWKLFNSAKAFEFLSIVVEGNLWKYILMTACDVYLPLLYHKFVHGVSLNPVIFIEIIILRSDITCSYLYTYMWYIIVIYTFVQMIILILINFPQRERICCFLAL